ncbi:MAG: hypothetical protein ABIR71_09210 [Chthoniobacterales bacterium]
MADNLGGGSRAGVRARESRELGEILAERMVREGLAAVGWKVEDLRRQAKGHAVKVAIARRLRANPPMGRGVDRAASAHGQHELPVIAPGS